MTLSIPEILYLHMWQHAQSCLPEECVGVLGGENHEAHSIYPLRNIAPIPTTHYAADTVELLRAFLAMQKEGIQCVAIYHSHPLGPSQPSASDLVHAHYDVPYIILNMTDNSSQAFLLPENTQVTLHIV